MVHQLTATGRSVFLTQLFPDAAVMAKGVVSASSATFTPSATTRSVRFHW
jgi:hypothetical protein